MNLLTGTEINLNDLSAQQLEALAIWITKSLDSNEMNPDGAPYFLSEDDARILWAIGYTERSIVLARIWAYICNPLPF